MTMDLPEGFSCETAEGGFTLAAPLRCPVSEARCLAMVCASWVRAAVGADAAILWPNHVVLDGRRVCAVTCRATAGGTLVFTFRPDPAVLPVPAEDFRAGVLAAAVPALTGYPENRADLLTAYCEHCRTVMKFVHTAYRGMPLYGFAFAVDKHGGLMVMTQESRTVVTLYGGEAEIVRREDGPEETPELPPMPGR